MKEKSAVFVSDPKGWDIECPSFEELFFGVRALRDGGKYVHYNDGGVGRCGHIEIQGRSEAMALRNKLNNTGDWLSPKTGEIERPSYAIQKLP